MRHLKLVPAFEETQAQTIEAKPKPRKRTEREKVGNLAWYPKLQRWKAASAKVYFDPNREEAYSYDWWRFVERIDGLLVFNSYRYSVMTSKHQSSVRRLLDHLGIGINLEIEAPQGLGNLDSAIRYYQRCIETLEKAMAVKGSHKRKNHQRRCEIIMLEGKNPRR